VCVAVVAVVTVVAVVSFDGAFCGVTGCGSIAFPSAPLLGSGDAPRIPFADGVSAELDAA
jgi:hypothetical protein